MKKALPLILLLVCAAAFVLGLVALFKLRFEAGDVYPAYSSLRADPLGTMAFYESLERMPSLSARRDLSSANRLPDGKQTTYLHLAGDVHGWKKLPEDTFKEISAFLAGGGRLVVTFFPQTAESYRFDKKKADDDKPAKKRKKLKGDDDDEVHFVSLTERWGVEFDFKELKQNDDTYEPIHAVNQTDLPLPDSISWHSAVVFTNLSKSWQTIYARDTQPVVIERKFGAGSVVLAGDSYFLSNEAMRSERHADLLSWLVGPNSRVIFDEAHFGIMEAPGIAALARKYRLHGLIAGLVLLAGLFIWKNSVSLAPPYAEEKRETHVAGKDSAAGFVNLLRRNISSRDVLKVCFAEWNRSFARSRKFSADKQQRIQAALEAENAASLKDRDPIKTYQTVCQILKSSALSDSVLNQNQPHEH